MSTQTVLGNEEQPSTMKQQISDARTKVLAEVNRLLDEWESGVIRGENKFDAKYGPADSAAYHIQDSFDAHLMLYPKTPNA